MFQVISWSVVWLISVCVRFTVILTGSSVIASLIVNQYNSSQYDWRFWLVYFVTFMIFGFISWFYKVSGEEAGNNFRIWLAIRADKKASKKNQDVCKAPPEPMKEHWHD